MVKRSFLLLLIGDDRPGLVEAISRTAADHDASWQESRLVRLQGQFAGVIRVECLPESAASLQAALEALEMTMVIRSVDEDSVREACRSITLELTGPERPGIIREWSTAVTALGINVDELESDCVSAPWTGELLFRAKARLAVPSSVSLQRLRDDLERVGHEMTLEIDWIEHSSPV